MITPEERAADVLQHYTHICGGAPYDPLFLGRLIVDAIRAAIRDAVDDAQIKIARAYLDGAATEREACARVAETYLKKPYADGRLIDVGELQAVTHIAAAIRARGEG